MSDLSRKQFEEWYQADIPNWSMRFHRENNSKKSYSFTGTEKAWQAWQAGRKAQMEDLKLLAENTH